MTKELEKLIERYETETKEERERLNLIRERLDKLRDQINDLD